MSDYEDEEYAYEMKELKKRRMLMLIGAVIAVALIIFASYVTGAIVSCPGALDGFTCVEPHVIGACEDIAGNLYQVPGVTNN